MKHSFGNFLKELKAIIEQGAIDEFLGARALATRPNDPKRSLCFILDPEDIKLAILKALNTSPRLEDLLLKIWSDPSDIAGPLKQLPVNAVPRTSNLAADFYSDADFRKVRFSVFVLGLEEAIRIYFRRYPASEQSEATKPAEKSPGQRPRVELDKPGQQVRIDDTYYQIPGERRVELVEILLDAPIREWTAGKAIQDKGRVRRTLERLPAPVRKIIDGPRPGTGGYRIKPKYRT